MTFRVHHPDSLGWRKIGDIDMGWMRDHLDATELEGQLAFHEGGDAETPQLMEMRLNPDTLIAPHSHDKSEIVFVVEGSIHWGDQSLEAGGSLYIAADTPYTYRTGPKGARLLNIRSREDHSFNPVDG
jgi:hypothetical protein